MRYEKLPRTYLEDVRTQTEVHLPILHFSLPHSYHRYWKLGRDGRDDKPLREIVYRRETRQLDERVANWKGIQNLFHGILAMHLFCYNIST